METQAILEQFAMLTGLDERQAGQYRPLCENARAQVLGIAKPNVGLTGDMALCSAAAALAFYEKRWYVMISQDGREKLLKRKDGRSHEAS